MPLSENLCWEVLNKTKGKSVLIAWLKGNDSEEPAIENAIPLFVLERDLVLHYVKTEIEDSLYFLEKRGYIIRHGFHGLTRVAYQLSDSAIEVLEKGSFTQEEQEAFKEALFDLKKPGWLGMNFNLGEVIRRFKKR